MGDADHRYARGLRALEQRLEEGLRKNLQPPPKLTISQWSERYAVLSKETSAQTGRFRAFPYQTGIMDAISDPAVTTVTVKKSARVGYTKILDHVVGYYVHQDPSPILMVQPRVKDAEDYSKTEIVPMLRDTPVLAVLAGDMKAKDSNQTILKKVFQNGSSLSLVGANSPGGFRRITARVVLFDEVDGYPTGGAGMEGDQIALGNDSGGGGAGAGDWRCWCLEVNLGKCVAQPAVVPAQPGASAQCDKNQRGKQHAQPASV